MTRLYVLVGLCLIAGRFGVADGMELSLRTKESADRYDASS